MNTNNVIGNKRKRCGICSSCTASDCGVCRYCRDKPKFGGKGVLKQCCVQRKCKRLRTALTGTYHLADLLITVIHVMCTIDITNTNQDNLKQPSPGITTSLKQFSPGNSTSLKQPNMKQPSTTNQKHRNLKQQELHSKVCMVFRYYKKCVHVVRIA